MVRKGLSSISIPNLPHFSSSHRISQRNHRNPRTQSSESLFRTTEWRRPPPPQPYRNKIHVFSPTTARVYWCYIPASVGGGSSSIVRTRRFSSQCLCGSDRPSSPYSFWNSYRFSTCPSFQRFVVKHNPEANTQERGRSRFLIGDITRVARPVRNDRRLPAQFVISREI